MGLLLPHLLEISGWKWERRQLNSLSLVDYSKVQFLRIVCLEVSHVAQQNWLCLITDCGQAVADRVIHYLVLFAIFPCLSSLSSLLLPCLSLLFPSRAWTLKSCFWLSYLRNHVWHHSRALSPLARAEALIFHWICKRVIFRNQYKVL